MNRTVKIIISVVVLLAVGAGSFYGGSLYGRAQAQAEMPLLFDQTADGQPAFPGPFGQAGAGQSGAVQPGQGRIGGAMGGRAMAGGGMTFGQIQSIDGTDVTLTGADDKAIHVKVTDTTLIEKNASVGIGDLEVGESVTVSGTTNEDGSITARSMSVIPAGRFSGATPGGAAPGGAAQGGNSSAGQ